MNRISPFGRQVAWRYRKNGTGTTRSHADQFPPDSVLQDIRSSISQVSGIYYSTALCGPQVLRFLPGGFSISILPNHCFPNGASTKTQHWFLSAETRHIGGNSWLCPRFILIQLVVVFSFVSIHPECFFGFALDFPFVLRLLCSGCSLWFFDSADFIFDDSLFWWHFSPNDIYPNLIHHWVLSVFLVRLFDYSSFHLECVFCASSFL